ncbi:hypothetical protein ASC97_31340 [Rhizobium sp. Root1203]|nr:hypothetical protein ASC97_31340 [Rhizobium sp. Root1203]
MLVKVFPHQESRLPVACTKLFAFPSRKSTISDRRRNRRPLAGSHNGTQNTGSRFEWRNGC